MKPYLPYITPQEIYRNRVFKKVVLEPPDHNPGSWRGAGKVIYDTENEEYIMTCRPRKARPERGYAVEIYTSTDGENYRRIKTLTRDELKEKSGLPIISIEAQQILRDPATNLFYLYIAIDVGRNWDTLLMVSDDLKGEWESKGVVLQRDRPYDSREARDTVIDIINGLYICLYKASSGQRTNMGLAISSDGIEWRKIGLLPVLTKYVPQYFVLYGDIYPTPLGPLFIGCESTRVVNWAHVADYFSSYLIDIVSGTLIEVYRTKWEPLSEYENRDAPIHGYMNVFHDYLNERFLLYVEAIAPGEIGTEKEFDRVILYESLYKL